MGRLAGLQHLRLSGKEATDMLTNSDFLLHLTSLLSLTLLDLEPRNAQLQMPPSLTHLSMFPGSSRPSRPEQDEPSVPVWEVGRLQGLTGLQRLSLGQAELHSRARLSFPNLEELFLQGINVTRGSLPLEAILGSGLLRLRKATLDDCDGLVEAVAGASCLQMLSLQSSSFSYLPGSSFERLLGLQQLCLSKCQLEVLPESLSQLAQLQALELRGMKQLLGLGEVLLPLHSLRRISLVGCSLLGCAPLVDSLPRGMTQLALEDMEMVHEGAQSLSGISQLSQLSRLRLCGLSRMQELPEEVVSLGSLCSLQVASLPDLVLLPKSFSSLTSLCDVEFSQCPLLYTWPLGIRSLPLLQGSQADDVESLIVANRIRRETEEEAADARVHALQAELGVVSLDDLKDMYEGDGGTKNCLEYEYDDDDDDDAEDGSLDDEED